MIQQEKLLEFGREIINSFQIKAVFLSCFLTLSLRDPRRAGVEMCIF